MQVILQWSRHTCIKHWTKILFGKHGCLYKLCIPLLCGFTSCRIIDRGRLMMIGNQRVQIVPRSFSMIRISRFLLTLDRTTHRWPGLWSTSFVHASWTHGIQAWNFVCIQSKQRGICSFQPSNIVVPHLSISVTAPSPPVLNTVQGLARGQKKRGACTHRAYHQQIELLCTAAKTCIVDNRGCQIGISRWGEFPKYWIAIWR